MENKSFTRFFKAIGDPTRIQILKVLSGTEKTVGEITDAVGLTQPTVSRHLSILRAAGIVSDSRQGQKVYYHLNKIIVENCCNDFCCQLVIAGSPAPAGKKGKK